MFVDEVIIKVEAGNIIKHKGIRVRIAGMSVDTIFVTESKIRDLTAAECTV